MVAGFADVTKAIRSGDDEFERNVRGRNAAQLVEAFYAKDAVVMPPGQPMVSGRAQVVEFWQGMFGMGLRDARLEIVRVEASGDLACEIGQYALTIGPEGAAPTLARGKYLVAHRRQADGSWRAIADMFSADSPG
jgi:ketosteroid isomerase-like protein